MQVDEEEVNNQVNDYNAKDLLPIAIAETNKKNEPGKPQIVKKKTVSREDSLVFWGWKIGFGIMAFEKADSRRHFRLLPLYYYYGDNRSILKGLYKYVKKDGETKHTFFWFL